MDRREGVLGARVAIVGSRDYPNLGRVKEYVAALPAGTTVVSGGARGVDRTAAEAARLHGLKVLEFPADWLRHGKAAGYMRNRLIVANADRVVAFQYNASRGTQHTINLARDAGLDVEIWND